jgi:hypothetical protein
MADIKEQIQAILDAEEGPLVDQIAALLASDGTPIDVVAAVAALAEVKDAVAKLDGILNPPPVAPPVV